MSGAVSALEALTAQLSLNRNLGSAYPQGSELFQETFGGTPSIALRQSDAREARQHPNAESLQRTSSGEIEVDKPDAEADQLPDGEVDERYLRMREKNRRAQQRFRQRQKAKLQARELETLQLQKQVHDLQTQLASIQVRGTLPETNLQIARLQAQNQALQLENAELRLVANRLLEDNAALQAGQQLGSRLTNKAEETSPSGPMLASSLPSLGPVSTSTRRAQPPLLAALPGQNQTNISLIGPVLRALAAPRESVFSSLKKVPWQRANRFLEDGIPVGVSPGGTGMAVLVKVLSKTASGSSTVLVQFPPGFVHDYILSTEAYMEEGLILAGSLTDTAFNQVYYPGDYAHVLPGTRHGPYRADNVEGALILTFTRTKVGMQQQQQQQQQR